MDSIKQKVDSEENIIEKILHKIPGFSSYKERENRRAADKILRDHLAKRLNHERDRIDDVVNTVAGLGMLDKLNTLDNIKKKMEKIADTIKYSDYGYAGFFDAVKINEPELAKLYNFDMSLLNDLTMIEEHITALESAEEADDVNTRIKALDSVLKEFDKKVSRRKEVILEVV